MSAPVAMRSQYSDLYGSAMLPVLEELFANGMEQYPQIREQLFAVKSTDRDIWQATEILDMDLFNQIAEGEEYSYKKPRQGSSKTLTMQKFGLGFSISEEAVADGKFDLIAEMTRKLAQSGRESQEIQAMNIFNNGFGTELSADGQAVFSSSHVMGSSTFRNQLASAADLSEASLQTALIDFETVFVGDTGIIKRYAPKVLLVHPSNKRYAMELVGSELKPDTGDNNMNSLKGDGLQVISSPHLTDADAWFLLGAPEDTGLRLVKREPLQTKVAGADVGFHSDSIFYKAKYREKIGVTHAQAIFGSPGA
jgi:hypothetical protein